MKSLTILPILALLLGACTVDPPVDIGQRIDAYLTDLEINQEFSGSVLIARDGQILLSKGYGWADRGNQVPNTPQTRYRIHWITMPFTATAIMQLAADGKLNVRDDLCRYIPECPDYWSEITIHHLLTHTSGVSDWIQPWEGEDAKPATGMERVELIKGKAPYFKPGEQLRYSGNGYIILGAIIEAVSGQSYIEYLNTNILQPLGMVDTGFEGNGVAVGYKPNGDAAPVPDLLFRYSASGLYSSVQDLYKLDQALIGESLLAREYLDAMFTGYARTPSVDFAGSDYGYGWFIGETLGRKLIFHGGAMSGYSGGLMRFPDERVTIIVLRNYELEIYDRLEIELAKMVFGDK